MSNTKEAIQLAQELVTKQKRLEVLVLQMNHTQWRKYFLAVGELVGTLEQ